MPKTEPLIPRAVKEVTARKPREKQSRTERAQSIADLCPAGWDLVASEPHTEDDGRFQCACAGWGKSGYILQARGPVKTGAQEQAFYSPSGLPEAWQSFITGPIVKVGRSCLYHFATGRKVAGEVETVEDVLKRALARG